jgi:hypothetical protein
MSNNWMYEWGLNCKTMGLDKEAASNAKRFWGDFSVDDNEQFWSGYSEEARADGVLVPIPSQVRSDMLNENLMRNMGC